MGWRHAASGVFQAMLMVTLDDCEKLDDHPEKVRNKVAQLASQCGKLQSVLDGLYRPKLRVVTLDG